MVFGQNTRRISQGIFFFGIQINVIIYGKKKHSYFDYVSKFVNNCLKQNMVTALEVSNKQFSFTKNHKGAEVSNRQDTLGLLKHSVQTRENPT